MTTSANTAHIRNAAKLFVVLHRYRSRKEGRNGVGHIVTFLPGHGWIDTCTCNLPTIETKRVSGGPSVGE